jgi:hypothetical protein
MRHAYLVTICSKRLSTAKCNCSICYSTAFTTTAAIQMVCINMLKCGDLVSYMASYFQYYAIGMGTGEIL